MNKKKKAARQVNFLMDMGRGGITLLADNFARCADLTTQAEANMLGDSMRNAIRQSLLETMQKVYKRRVPTVQDSMQFVLNYMENEEGDYEDHVDSGHEPSDHIFYHLKVLRDHFDKIDSK